MLPDQDIPARVDRTARLEQAFIADFLALGGFTAASLDQLPEADRHAILRAASAYASSRLAEVESRAHYIHELHHTE